MEPILTIFTPTYNRAYTLNLCYESLKRQTVNQFIWLIIDDGSTDETKELVQKWIMENKVKIRYHYQANQGMHGAHNTAYRLIDTELNVCIDSDDYMPEDAVEKITLFWKKHGSDKYAGMVGLDASRDGRVIGTRLPKNIKVATYLDLYSKYKVKGDKKLVYRTELTRKTPPYPLYPGEKYCPLAYKYILIDQECPLLLLDEILCHVEYLRDGSSMNIIHQYKKNPRGFSIYRIVSMTYAGTLTGSIRSCIHYVSSSLISRDKYFLRESPKKLLTIACVPFGVILYLYIMNTKKATVLKI